MSECDTLEAPTRDDDFRIYCETHDLYAHYECPYSRIAELEGAIRAFLDYDPVNRQERSEARYWEVYNGLRAALREGE